MAKSNQRFSNRLHLSTKSVCLPILETTKLFSRNKIRRFLETKLKLAGITTIDIKRSKPVDIFMNVFAPVSLSAAVLFGNPQKTSKTSKINPKAKIGQN